MRSLYAPRNKRSEQIGPSLEARSSISRPKRAEAKLPELSARLIKESLETNLRELSVRLINSQDQERRRIARDLHDNMGQVVAFLKMNLGQLAKLTKPGSESAHLLGQSLFMVDRMSAELRTISFLLHPPLLDEIGLLSALRELVDGFSQRSGIDTSLQIDDNLNRLSSEVEISIYRIIQEGLTNIHRHSGSLTAAVRIERHPCEIYVEIQDQGRGMPAEKRTAGLGIGLSGMRERANQFGGTLEVRSDARGTKVILRLPLSP